MTIPLAIFFSLYTAAAGILLALIFTAGGGDFWSELTKLLPLALAVALGWVLAILLNPNPNSSEKAKALTPAQIVASYVFDVIAAVLLATPAFFYLWENQKGPLALIGSLLFGLAMLSILRWTRAKFT